MNSRDFLPLSTKALSKTWSWLAAVAAISQINKSKGIHVAPVETRLHICGTSGILKARSPDGLQPRRRARSDVYQAYAGDKGIFNTHNRTTTSVRQRFVFAPTRVSPRKSKSRKSPQRHLEFLITRSTPENNVISCSVPSFTASCTQEEELEVPPPELTQIRPQAEVECRVVPPKMPVVQTATMHDHAKEPLTNQDVVPVLLTADSGIVLEKNIGNLAENASSEQKTSGTSKIKSVAGSNTAIDMVELESDHRPCFPAHDEETSILENRSDEYSIPGNLSVQLPRIPSLSITKKQLLLADEAQNVVLERDAQTGEQPGSASHQVDGGDRGDSERTDTSAILSKDENSQRKSADDSLSSRRQQHGQQLNSGKYIGEPRTFIGSAIDCDGLPELGESSIVPSQPERILEDCSLIGKLTVEETSHYRARDADDHSVLSTDDGGRHLVPQGTDFGLCAGKKLYWRTTSCVDPKIHTVERLPLRKSSLQKASKHVFRTLSCVLGHANIAAPPSVTSREVAATKTALSALAEVAYPKSEATLHASVAVEENERQSSAVASSGKQSHHLGLALGDEAGRHVGDTTAFRESVRNDAAAHVIGKTEALSTDVSPQLSRLCQEAYLKENICGDSTLGHAVRSSGRRSFGHHSRSFSLNRAPGLSHLVLSPQDDSSRSIQVDWPLTSRSFPAIVPYVSPRHAAGSQNASLGLRVASSSRISRARCHGGAITLFKNFDAEGSGVEAFKIREGHAKRVSDAEERMPCSIAEEAMRQFALQQAGASGTGPSDLVLPRVTTNNEASCNYITEVSTETAGASERFHLYNGSFRTLQQIVHLHFAAKQQNSATYIPSPVDCPAVGTERTVFMECSPEEQNPAHTIQVQQDIGIPKLQHNQGDGAYKRDRGDYCPATDMSAHCFQHESEEPHLQESLHVPGRSIPRVPRKQGRQATGSQNASASGYCCSTLHQYRGRDRAYHPCPGSLLWNGPLRQFQLQHHKRGMLLLPSCFSEALYLKQNALRGRLQRQCKHAELLQQQLTMQQKQLQITMQLQQAQLQHQRNQAALWRSCISSANMLRRSHLGRSLKAGCIRRRGRSLGRSRQKISGLIEAAAAAAAAAVAAVGACEQRVQALFSSPQNVAPPPREPVESSRESGQSALLAAKKNKVSDVQHQLLADHTLLGEQIQQESHRITQGRLVDGETFGAPPGDSSCVAWASNKLNEEKLQNTLSPIREAAAASTPPPCDTGADERSKTKYCPMLGPISHQTPAVEDAIIPSMPSPHIPRVEFECAYVRPIAELEPLLPSPVMKAPAEATTDAIRRNHPSPHIPRIESESAYIRPIAGLEPAFPSPVLQVHAGVSIADGESYHQQVLASACRLTNARRIAATGLQFNGGNSPCWKGMHTDIMIRPARCPAGNAILPSSSGIGETNTVSKSHRRSRTDTSSLGRKVESRSSSTPVQDKRSRTRKQFYPVASCHEGTNLPLLEGVQGTPGRYGCKAVPVAYQRDPSMSIFNQLFTDSVRRQKNLILLRTQKLLEDNIYFRLGKTYTGQDRKKTKSRKTPQVSAGRFPSPCSLDKATNTDKTCGVLLKHDVNICCDSHVSSQDTQLSSYAERAGVASKIWTKRCLSSLSNGGKSNASSRHEQSVPTIDANKHQACLYHSRMLVFHTNVPEAPQTEGSKRRTQSADPENSAPFYLPPVRHVCRNSAAAVEAESIL